MNRRQALTLMGMAWLPAVASDDFTDDENDDLPRTPAELARFAAEWDLRALQHNQPDDWDERAYVDCAQWNDRWAVFIGVGPVDWASDRAARAMALLCDVEDDDLVATVPIAGAYRTTCGRAWCIVVEGKLTQDARDEFKRPVWRI